MLAFRLNARRLIPIEAKADSLDDLTRQLPRGLYTTFSTNSGGRRVLGLGAHLERLFAPTESTLTPSASRADLRLTLAKVALSHAPGESRFRLLLSASDGTVYLLRQPFVPPPGEIYARGVNVITVELTRHDPRLKDSVMVFSK